MTDASPLAERLRAGAPPLRLKWGIKQSFREYVRAISDARLEVDSLPSESWEQEFAFAAAEQPGTLESGSLSFSGEVFLSGYRGMLAVRVRDPRIVQTGADLVLDIMHPDFRDATTERLPVALLGSFAPAQDDDQQSFAAQATLLASATRVFDDIYAPGTELDPVTIEFS